MAQNSIGALSSAQKSIRVDVAIHQYGISKTKLYRLMKEGVLPSVSVGRRRLLLVSGLDRLIGIDGSGETSPATPAPPSPPMRKAA